MAPMSVELGPVNVTVRRDALRRQGIEATYLEKCRHSSVNTFDEHLVNLAFMSSSDATYYTKELLALGLTEPEDIAAKGSDWFEFEHRSFPEAPVLNHSHAWLRGSDPGVLMEMTWLLEKRDKLPFSRPWRRSEPTQGTRREELC